MYKAVANKAGNHSYRKNFSEGIIYKGVGKDYNFTNLEEYLVDGKIPNLKSELNTEV